MQPLVRQKSESAGELLRFWRQLHRISQMDLALDVGVSTKHLSFLETGRSQPSRQLVLKIAQALKLPLRHRNAFLRSAGYASEFGEEPFDGPRMQVVRQALGRMLEKHEPYPAFVVDTGYRILMVNGGLVRLVQRFVGQTALQKYDNVFRLLFAQDGLRPYVQEWPTVEHLLLARLWEEVLTTQNSGLIALYQELSRSRSGAAPLLDLRLDAATPVLSLTLVKGSLKAALFSTIATLGTPLDATAQELRIELLFPADEATERLFALAE